MEGTPFPLVFHNKLRILLQLLVGKGNATKERRNRRGIRAGRSKREEGEEEGGRGSNIPPCSLDNDGVDCGIGAMSKMQYFNYCLLPNFLHFLFPSPFLSYLAFCWKLN